MALIHGWQGRLCVFVVMALGIGSSGIAKAASETPPPILMQQASEPPESEPDLPDEARTSWLAQLINKSEIDLFVLNSIRRDQLQWSIAGNSAGTNPDILSELTWSDVHSYQITIGGRALINRMVFLRGALDYGWIQSGRVRDSDYSGDDRQGEYSRSISQSGGDQVWDFSFGAGYPFLLVNNRLLIAPLLGYSYHVQNLRVTDGEQVITYPTGPALGSLDGLDSTYRARWMGPWLGCDLRYRFFGGTAGDPPMELGLSLELHRAEYSAEANWNLIRTFDHPTSFEHEADGMGYSLTTEWLIELAMRWDVTVRFHYQHWRTDSGRDRIHYASGGTGTQQLNEVEWYTKSFMLGVTYHF
jgi:hypothetical protein